MDTKVRCVTKPKTNPIKQVGQETKIIYIFLRSPIKKVLIYRLISKGVIAQFGRALALHASGYVFKSR